MAEFVENLPESRRGIGDGPASRVRTGFVAVASIEAARGATGIPKRGDAHPTDPTLFCDNVEFTTNGAWVDVTIYYSDSGEFRPISLIRKRDGWYQWLNVIPRREVIDIPMNKRVRRTISQPGGAPSIDQRVFAIDKYPVQHIFKVWPLEVYAKILDRSSLNRHADMLDHIHTISGTKLKFLGLVNIREEGDKFYTLTYQWEQDPGTPRMEVLQGTPLPGELLPPIAFFPPYNRPPSDIYHRLPYEKLTVQESSDPRTNYHATLGFMTQVVAPDEWRQLPGIPRNL